MEFPAGLRYTKEHVWVRLEGAEAVVGITDHAQKELGDIVFVETPKPGAAVTPGKPFGLRGNSFLTRASIFESGILPVPSVSTRTLMGSATPMA